MEQAEVRHCGAMQAARSAPLALRRDRTFILLQIAFVILKNEDKGPNVPPHSQRSAGVKKSG
jgi:hypothetical protein